MCGIAGVVHSDPSNRVAPNLIRAMCDRITHRGPDDFGDYVIGRVGMGMRRLSIIDLHSGKQPISNEDGTVWIVFNGEIYNFRSLRQMLEGKGHRFQTASDTEVIVHLYEEYGLNCVQHLRGMFAFAIWDQRLQQLLLARDRLGIKPLYYAQTDEGLVFGSELKTLLVHPRIVLEPSPEAIEEYFTHLCVPGDLSIYRSIHKLPAAHTLCYRGGDVQLDRYWHVQPSPDVSMKEEEWIGTLRDHMKEAVESHLVADVPVGAFLSGGLDSGAMVALMAGASADRVQTFTVGFEEDVSRFDERSAAREVADRYHTQHRECLLKADVTSVASRIIEAFDEPFADSSAIPNWLVCQETARHVKVVLSGLGADELFGGYERYVGLRIGEQYRHLPRMLRAAIARTIREIPMGKGSTYRSDRLKRFVAAGELTSPERYRSYIAAFPRTEEILSADVYASIATPGLRYSEIMRELNARDPLDVGLYSDLYIYLPDDLLTLSDRVSMAHSLEVRVPFLDHHLVELASRIPARLKVYGLRKKVLFRRAIEPWIPAGHLKRRKQGFSVPLAAWLKGPLRPMIQDLAESKQLRESPWLNHATVMRLIAEHLSGESNHEIRLWAIVCFLEWERQFEEISLARSVSA